VEAIEKTIHRRWKELRYEGLLPDERDYLVLWWLMAEVNNGGFHQYFFNSTADSALQAVAVLRSLDASETLGNLLRAIDVLGGVDTFKTDWTARREQVSEIDPSAFDALDSEFYDATEDFMNLAIERVAAAYAAQAIVV